AFDIAQRLRERYENEEVDYLPLLVALTANIMQTKEEYQQQGMDDVLRKPLSLEALSECLNHYFNSDFSEKTAEIPPLVETE
ncbi:hybrid sensor histidine kinase/response regulator, partial [Xanthomonas citri pv. citri]|nr:hybrid sensor histidine kinase/response regulator [Xanthomonas citri pv. citri]